MGEPCLLLEPYFAVRLCFAHIYDKMHLFFDGVIMPLNGKRGRNLDLLPTERVEKVVAILDVGRAGTRAITRFVYSAHLQRLGDIEDGRFA